MWKHTIGKQNQKILRENFFYKIKECFCLKNIFNGVSGRIRLWDILYQLEVAFIQSSPLIKSSYVSRSSPRLKIHAHFFSSCVMKNLIKTVFRPPNQSRSKDFNQVGGRIGGKFGQNSDFDFGLQSQCEVCLLKI